MFTRRLQGGHHAYEIDERCSHGVALHQPLLSASATSSAFREQAHRADLFPHHPTGGGDCLPHPPGGWGPRHALPSARRADACAVARPLAPSPSAEAPAGPRGVRAAPPPPPHPCSFCRGFAFRTAEPAHAPGKPKRRHYARGSARSRSLRASALCGPQPEAGGGVSSGAHRLTGPCDLIGSTLSGAGAIVGAPSHAARPCHCRVVDCTVRAALHRLSRYGGTAAPPFGHVGRGRRSWCNPFFTSRSRDAPPVTPIVCTVRMPDNRRKHAGDSFGSLISITFN
jgi:hypothetical protein